jgi:integrase
VEALAGLEAFRESLAFEGDSSTEEITSNAYYSRAESFFSAVKGAIKARDLDSTGRQSKILALISKSQLPKGNASRELGKYALHLATRYKIHGSGTLGLNTVERDWYNLEKGFLEYASDINMIGMDEDDVTNMYAGVVAASGNRQYDDDDPRNLDAKRRASREIQLFHEFCATTLGIPDPEWAEFCEPSTWVNIRPGTVSLNDVGRSLNLLLHKEQPADLTTAALRAALVLILCSRFGLRVGEAIGLQRRDIYYKEKVVVVFVRPNSIRPIKTDNSKRVIPLVETLSTSELSILNEALTRWERRAIRNTHQELFEGVNSQNFKSNRSRTSGLIADALRIATGVPSTTTHHLRHAYAMRVMALITNKSLSLTGTLNSEVSKHVQKLLLGKEVTDKRNLWAIARLLGHGSPGVTVLSYTHTLATWIAKPYSTEQQYTQPELVVDFNLEKLPRSSEVNIDENTKLGFSILTFNAKFAQLLTFARNIGSSVDPDKASERAGMRYSERNYFEEQFKKLVNRIQPALEADEFAAKKILTDLPITAWERLFTTGKLFHSKGKLQLPNWDLLINNRSEIIIHEEYQIDLIKEFLLNFDSKKTKFKLIYHPESSASFVSAIKSGPLPSSSAIDEVPPRRIDRHNLPSGIIFKNRAVVHPIKSSITRLELCILWFIYCIA